MPIAGEMTHVIFGKNTEKGEIYIGVLFCSRLKLGMG